MLSSSRKQNVDFINKNILRPLKQEIALTIPARNEYKTNAKVKLNVYLGPVSIGKV